jgi:membrane protein implicated in regulation of membrane protease activity
VHLADIVASIVASVLALTASETLLIRLAVLLFAGMVLFCAVVWRQVAESTRIAKAANDLATELDGRTASIEERLGPKE